MAFKSGWLRANLDAAIKDRTPERLQEDLREAFHKKEVTPEDFSVRQLFEELLPNGREAVESWNPRYNGSSSQVSLSRLMEADAVRAAAFSSINQQLMYTTVLEGYQMQGMPFADLIPTQETPFNGERIPGIGGIGDKSEAVAEGNDYPFAGLNEDYIDTPATTKQGLIIPYTKEAIFFDRTGLIRQRGSEVGLWLRVNKEKRAIDAIIDENRTIHRYNRLGRGRIATYGDNSGTHDFDNLQASNGLTDWTDIDNARLLYNSLLDPNTGEPINMIGKRYVIVTDALSATALRIRNATEVTIVSPGYATTGNPIETKSPNPVANTFEVLTSPMLANRLATDTDWFYGDPARAIRWMQNWGLAVVQAPPNSHNEFHKDIVLEYKASERGEYAVVEPRALEKNTA